jgi:ferritin-like metal-binding protein YciE
MPKINTLEEAFVDEIRDLYDAEKQLVRALPKMARAASSQELRDAFREHLEVTKGQVGRLGQIFETMGQKARSKPCKGMKGLLEEGQEIISEDTEEHIGDLALIGAAQKVEHYEISGYGTLRTFAQAMGQKEVAQLLDQTLKEEEATDKKLTMIAKGLYKEAQKSERSSGGGNSSASRSRGGAASSRGSRSRTSEVGGVEAEDVER